MDEFPGNDVPPTGASSNSERDSAGPVASPSDVTELQAAVIWKKGAGCTDSTVASDVAMRKAIDAFLRDLYAATVPSDGGRRVPDFEGAQMFSRATQQLHDNLVAWFLPPSIPRAGVKIVRVFSNRNVPLKACVMHPDDNEADARRHAAFIRLLDATMFTAAQWNAMQDANPGGNHMRWLPGNVIPDDQIALVKSVRRLLRPSRQGQSSVVSDRSKSDGVASPAAKRGQPSTGEVAKRSWTQLDLNEAIRKYKAERASSYNDLVAGVKRGDIGATRDARKMFGRNAIAKALGVRSPAMVSKSPVWQAIADELNLRGRNRSKSPKPKSIGLDIALESQAKAANTPPLDQMIHQETIELIEKSMPAREAEATVEKLMRGEISDDQARDLVDVYSQQPRDQRTRTARRKP